MLQERLWEVGISVRGWWPGGRCLMGGLGLGAATAGFGSRKGPKGSNVFGGFFLSERFVFFGMQGIPEWKYDRSAK